MEPGSVIAERFVIERCVGAGGMGSVYSARDRSTGERVAVKLLHDEASPDIVERFGAEARILAELHHPGIVRYIDHGATEDHRPYLAMEWIEGEDLTDRIRRGQLSLADSVRLASTVGLALGSVHSRGVVHRDVKPANIHLAGGNVGAAKVLDFGIARAGGMRGTKTRTGMVMGTANYMSPEQARGDSDIDARADVYSLGCVLFECLTGRPPFEGEHLIAILVKIVMEQAPRVASLRPDVPVALDELVARMLAKEPAERPRDGAAVAVELAQVSPEEVPLRQAAPARATLTTGERSLLSVILIAGREFEAPTVATTTSGLPPAEARASLPAARVVVDVREAIEDLVQDHGGQLEQLRDRSMVLSFWGRDAGGATDLAARAARCALAVRRYLPWLPMALATGRGELSGPAPIGEAIDRAARLLHVAAISAAQFGRGKALGVRIDEVTAGLLDARFEVGGDAHGLDLEGERKGDDPRMLLGRPSPFVGRDREMGTLGALLDECIAEPTARAVLVTAPPGGGKSRLRHELLRRVAARAEPVPVDVWLGRGDAMSAGSAFGVLGRALRHGLGIVDGEPAPVRQQKLRARVAGYAPAGTTGELAPLLGELCGVPFPDEDHPALRAARQDKQLLGDLVRRAWVEFLRAALAARPLVIVLEDLHWGDLPSVQLVDDALRAVSDRPLFVLALARPEVRELFPALWSGRGVVELPLAELSRKASEKLVRQVLGDRVTQETLERVVARAAGSAFYLEELIRAVAEGRGDALPETVLAMVQARLESLAPEPRRVLRAASVFGETFWASGIAELLGGGRQTTAALDELATGELVVHRSAGRFPAEIEFAFRHALVRDAAHSMLTDGDRSLGHRLAGAWLERAGETDSLVLAEHLERGGEPLGAAMHYLRAAEQALAGNDLGAAIERADRGVRCGAEGELLGRLRQVQCDAHAWRADFPEAAARSAEAMTLLSPGSAVWYAAAAMAVISSGNLGDRARFSAVTQALATQGPRGERCADQPKAWALTAWLFILLGRRAEAEPFLSWLEERVPAVAEPELTDEGWVAIGRFWGAIYEDNPTRVIGIAEAAVRCFEAAGDVRNLAVAREHFGWAFLSVGAWDDAERELRAAFALADQTGSHYIAAMSLRHLGAVLLRRGRVDDAEHALAAAIETLHAQGHRRMECEARIYRSLLRLQAGSFGEAEAEAAQAARDAEGLPPIQAPALGALARALLAQGRAAEACIAAERAMQIVDRSSSLGELEAMVRLAHVAALTATGRMEAANAAVATARARLLTRAAHLDDPARRATFLRDIPEHAATLKWGRD